jgi:hypothetical protein
MHGTKYSFLRSFLTSSPQAIAKMQAGNAAVGDTISVGGSAVAEMTAAAAAAAAEVSEWMQFGWSVGDNDALTDAPLHIPIAEDYQLIVRYSDDVEVKSPVFASR